MTHIDLGIDEATWTAALRVIGHPWRAGQRCTEGDHRRFSGIDSWYCVKHGSHTKRPHEVPIPTITDELLMRMLREGCGRMTVPIWFLDEIKGWMRLFDYTLDAAIIRATAPLDANTDLCRK